MGQSSSQMVQQSQAAVRDKEQSASKITRAHNAPKVPTKDQDVNAPAKKPRKQMAVREESLNDQQQDGVVQETKSNPKRDRLLVGEVEALITRLEAKARKFEQKSITQKRSKKLEAIKKDIEQLRLDLALALEEDVASHNDKVPRFQRDIPQPRVQESIKTGSVPEAKKRKRNHEAVFELKDSGLPTPDERLEDGEGVTKKRRKQKGRSLKGSDIASLNRSHEMKVPADEAEDEAYNPVFTQDNTGHVEAWLASQEPPDSLHDDLVTQQILLSNDRPAQSTKRKRRTAQSQGGHEDPGHAAARLLPIETGRTGHLLRKATGTENRHVNESVSKRYRSDPDVSPPIEPSRAAEPEVLSKKGRLTRVKKVKHSGESDELHHTSDRDASGKLGSTTRKRARRPEKIITPSASDGGLPKLDRARLDVSKEKPDDVQNFIAPRELEENSQPAAEGVPSSKPDQEKKRKMTKPASVAKQAAAEQLRRPDIPTVTSGSFTVDEKEIADRIWESISKEHQFSDAAMRAMIKDWRNAGPIKMELEAALPNRTKAQIRKFAQRRWHSHERGPWTEEQDKALRDAHARLGDQWVKISDLIDRSAADCKDRWRMHLQYGDNKATGPWSRKEEERLRCAVEECAAKIKENWENEEASIHSEDPLDALIDWNLVAEKLSGRRSSKQCRVKYEKLKRREQKTGSMQPQASAESQDSKQMQRARKVAENFELGDYLDVFKEISTTFPDCNVDFEDESVVLWSTVAQSNPDSRFNVIANGSRLRRAALQRAIEQWSHDSSKLRRKLDRVGSVPAKALVLAKWVEKCLAGRRSKDLPRNFMPELVGRSKEELAEVKRARQAKYGRLKREAISKDIVSDSEDDADDDYEARAQLQKMQRATRAATRRAAHSEVVAEPDLLQDDEERLAADALNATDERMSPERDIVKPEHRGYSGSVSDPGSDLVEETDPGHSDETNITQEVPDSQFKGEEANEIVVTPIKGEERDDGASNAAMSRKDFLKKCQDSGKTDVSEPTTSSSRGKRKRRSASKTRRSVYDLE